METDAQETFTLDNFEGPLDFLLHLIQKSELSIIEIPIQQIIAQFQARLQTLKDRSVEKGADFIGTAAFLVWLKSRMLLPKHEEEIEPQDPGDPRFEVIHLLLEYCTFKETAKVLSQKEALQGAYFPRGTPRGAPRGAESLPQIEKGLGIDHISLDDLMALFQKVLREAPARKKGEIHEETFRVQDKILFVRNIFTKKKSIFFYDLFRREHCKEELIVTFLAVLELMKNGEAALCRDQESGKIQLMEKHNEAN